MTVQEARRWAVVLAGGDGRRLSSLTSALYGSELPKQFAALDGARSLLQATLERIAPLVPPRRTVVVVPESHAALARRQLAGHEGVDLVLQPHNLDTGPGVLLPLARILARDPQAHVAIFPSDHHVSDATPLLQAANEAFAACRRAPEALTLLGVVPECADAEYGWIVPGAPVVGLHDVGLRRVERFVEKPAPDVARGLLDQGALWNTFVCVGHLSAFWNLASRHLPRHTDLFEAYARVLDGPEEASVLRSIYSVLTPANFSRSVLERAERLMVLAVVGSGWSDWGTPERVFRSLAGSERLDSLRQRMTADQSVPVAG